MTLFIRYICKIKKNDSDASKSKEEQDIGIPNKPSVFHIN